ncbi:MAG: hypothetical protein HY313_11845 [Acidobacteria bacterium]|nr:hypothetical protein [Acidobacteriota bacterium]
MSSPLVWVICAVVIDEIRRIGRKQAGALPVHEQPDIRCRGAVTAEQSVPANGPQLPARGLPLLLQFGGMIDEGCRIILFGFLDQVLESGSLCSATVSTEPPSTLPLRKMPGLRK